MVAPTRVVLREAAEIQLWAWGGVRGTVWSSSWEPSRRGTPCIWGCRPPSCLQSQLAGLGGKEVTCLEVIRASTCIDSPDNCPSFDSDTNPVHGTLPTLPYSPLQSLSFSPPPSLCVCVSLGPWVSVTLGLGLPHPTQAM
jgi:hypothetical protein